MIFLLRRLVLFFVCLGEKKKKIDFALVFFAHAHNLHMILSLKQLF